MKTQKPHILLLSLAIFPLLSLPAAVAEPSFYAGLQGGYSHGNVKIDHEFRVGAVPDPEKAQAKLKSQDFQGGFVLGGEAFIKPKIALGLQLITDFDTQKASSDLKHIGFVIPLKIQAQKRFTVIPSATFAYMIKPKLRAFLALGVGIGRFKFRLDNADDVHVLKKTPTKIGFASSLGVEYQFLPRWSGMGMVGFENYGTLKTVFDNPYGPGSGGVPNTATERIKSQYITAKVGVVFRFGNTHQGSAL